MVARLAGAVLRCSQRAGHHTDRRRAVCRARRVGAYSAAAAGRPGHHINRDARATSGRAPCRDRSARPATVTRIVMPRLRLAVQRSCQSNYDTKCPAALTGSRGLPASACELGTDPSLAVVEDWKDGLLHAGHRGQRRHSRADRSSGPFYEWAGSSCTAEARPPPGGWPSHNAVTGRGEPALRSTSGLGTSPHP